MINEVMAKAVTGIDENLISDAEKVTKKRNIIRPVFSVCAVAACLVLVFTFIFTANSNKTELFLSNSKITQSPTAVDVPMTAMIRAVDYNLTVNLDLYTKGATKITISGGEMNICSKGNTDTLYYTGTEYTADIPVSIHWTVDGSDIQKAYTLTLNDGESIYTLSYDETASNWSICKQ